MDRELHPSLESSPEADTVVQYHPLLQAAWKRGELLKDPLPCMPIPRHRGYRSTLLVISLLLCGAAAGSSRLVHGRKPAVVHDQERMAQPVAALSTEQKAPARQVPAAVQAAQADLDEAQGQLEQSRASLVSELRHARGRMERAAARLDTSQASLSQAWTDVREAIAHRDQLDDDLKRTRGLQAQGTATPEDVAARQSALDGANVALDEAAARLASAQASSDSSSGDVQAAHRQLHAARERVRQAKLNLEKAQRPAPRAAVAAAPRG